MAEHKIYIHNWSFFKIPEIFASDVDVTSSVKATLFMKVLSNLLINCYD
jgi:hypothetical protein